MTQLSMYMRSGPNLTVSVGKSRSYTIEEPQLSHALKWPKHNSMLKKKKKVIKEQYLEWLLLYQRCGQASNYCPKYKCKEEVPLGQYKPDTTRLLVTEPHSFEYLKTSKALKMGRKGQAFVLL